MTALARYNALVCALLARLRLGDDDETADALRDEMDLWWWRLRPAEQVQARRDSWAIEAALFGEDA